MTAIEEPPLKQAKVSAAGETAEAANEPQMALAFREAADEDFAFVYATWIKSFTRGGFLESVKRPLKASVPVPLLAGAQHKLIERILCKGARVLIAHPTGEPEVICGYVVTERDRKTLHWVYVKGPFRELGIARALMREAGKSIEQFTHQTDEGKRVLRYIPDAVFSPYF